MRNAGTSSHPLIQLTLTRLREFMREPEAVFWVFVFPILLAFGLGIAFRTQGETPVFVGIEANAGATDLMARLSGAKGLHAEMLRPGDEEKALRDGRVQVIVVPGSVPTYRFDPTRPESRLARLVVDEALQRAAGRTDAFQGREAPVEVIGSRYIDWLVPGLLGMNIMGTGMWGIGFSIVQARSKRILKRLAATPMARSHYLAAQVGARLVFLGLEVGSLLVAAWLMFRVPVRGSVITLGAVAVLGALALGGLGLLIAARPRTIEAVSGWMNAVMMPMWVLSGIFFSSSHFPAIMQPFIHALPLTALNDALRAIMLDGAGVRGILPEIGVMGAWTVGTFGLALRFFRWR